MVTTNPNQVPLPEPAARIDLGELFKDVPVLSSPDDLAAPEIFPDDMEFEESSRGFGSSGVRAWPEFSWHE